MNFPGKQIACTIGIIPSLAFSYCIFCVELVLLTKPSCLLCSVPCSISWFPHCWLLQILLIHLTMFPSVTVCKLHHHFLLYFLRIILLILRCLALPNWHEGWFGVSFTFTHSSKLWILWGFFSLLFNPPAIPLSGMIKKLSLLGGRLPAGLCHLTGEVSLGRIISSIHH